MKEEVKKWLKQAESDLKAASDSLKTGHYDWAAFQAQQAVEKGLKAIYIKDLGELAKVHDLVFLAEKIKAPSEIIKFCGKLTLVYTETRYPDASGKIPAEKFSRMDAEYFVSLA